MLAGEGGHLGCPGSPVGGRSSWGSGSRSSGPLQEPDLVVAVGGRRVGVAGDDERVPQAQLGALQDGCQQVDLSHDGVFVGDASEAPAVVTSDQPQPHPQLPDTAGGGSAPREQRQDKRGQP